MAQEFDLIQKYLAPLSGGEALGLLDDAALVPTRSSFDQVITKDLLVEGVHFRPGDTPETLACKALGVNYSDLAAKGAEPAFYFLGLALTDHQNEGWLREFAQGLSQMQQAYGGQLSGGDTVKTGGPLVISVTAVGYVPAGQMIRRCGAKPGHDIWVSGTLGDAAFGLAMLKGDLQDFDPICEVRYFTPEPRIALGQSLRCIASASADISDGLLADLGHICAASGVRAEVSLSCLPVRDKMADYLVDHPDLWPYVYAGGDDYELVFTAPLTERETLERRLASGIYPSLTRIGKVFETSDHEEPVVLLGEGGVRLSPSKTGYVHIINCGR